MEEERAAPVPARLIDLSLFPNGLISGLTMDEISATLDWQDVERLVQEQLRSDTDEEFSDLEALFAETPDCLEERLRHLEAEASAQGTRKHDVQYLNEFRKFMDKYPQVYVDESTCDTATLNKTLQYFYATLQRRDGGAYSPSTLVCIRASLFRHFMRLRGINIISDSTFYTANSTLKLVAKNFFLAGGAVKHYEEIDPVDLRLLGAYFDRSTPTRLLHELFYSIVYYFGTRGREWYRGLNVNSFIFDHAPDGTEIVRLREIRGKNLAKDLSRNACENVKESVMGSVPEAPHKCPVQCLKMYLHKREQSIPSTSSSESDRSPFFLKPKTIGFQNGTWFCRQPVGVNKICELMPDISAAAKLSRRYTAHCVRPTVIKQLKASGHPVEEICKVTGHKSASTVQRYLRFGSRRVEDMQSMCKTLNKSLHNDDSTGPKKLALESFPKASDDKSSHVTSCENPVESTLEKAGTGVSVVFNFHGPVTNCNFGKM